MKLSGEKRYLVMRHIIFRFLYQKIISSNLSIWEKNTTHIELHNIFHIHTRMFIVVMLTHINMYISLVCMVFSTALLTF